MSFHVPEPGRLGPADPRLGSSPYSSDASYGNNGAFFLPSPVSGWELFIIASDNDGWEHVSVHARDERQRKMRTPTWAEMMFVKRVCWDGDDACMQLAPPEDDYVSCHPATLHWWRPVGQTIPLPPSWMVGPSQKVIV